MSSGDIGLLVLRVFVGLLFAAHGAQKAFGWWSGPGFAGWTRAMERMNLRPTALWAAVSTAGELAGGLLLAFGFLVPVAVALIVGQVITIIGQVHLPKGFWNTKGGFEFPLSLGAAAIAVLGTGPGSVSLDAALKLSYPDGLKLGFLALGAIGGFVALALPRFQARNVPAPQAH